MKLTSTDLDSCRNKFAANAAANATRMAVSETRLRETTATAATISIVMRKWFRTYFESAVTVPGPEVDGLASASSSAMAAQVYCQSARSRAGGAELFG